jgi:hypothetical protein
MPVRLRDRRTAERRSLRPPFCPPAQLLAVEREALLPPAHAPRHLVRCTQGTGDHNMKNPSRRAVVRTGVWAVPVVATAAAVPAFAATSGEPPPVTIDGIGQGCKFPGHSVKGFDFGYRMVLTFHNTSGVPQPITVDSFTISGKATTEFTPKSFIVPDGDSTKLFIVQSTTSSQRFATVTYTVDGQTVTTIVDFGSFPPCKCKQNDADPADPNADCS